MKHVIFSAIFVMASLTASASTISGALSTTGGAVTSLEATSCVFNGTASEASTCSAVSTLSSSITSVNNKEDLQQVEADAFNFLAGEEMTLALREQIENIRLSVVETQNLNDQEVSFLIINALK